MENIRADFHSDHTDSHSQQQGPKVPFSTPFLTLIATLLLLLCYFETFATRSCYAAQAPSPSSPPASAYEVLELQMCDICFIDDIHSG